MYVIKSIFDNFLSCTYFKRNSFNTLGQIYTNLDLYIKDIVMKCIFFMNYKTNKPNFLKIQLYKFKLGK